MLEKKAIGLGGGSYFSEKTDPTLGGKGQSLAALPDVPLPRRPRHNHHPPDARVSSRRLAPFTA